MKYVQNKYLLQLELIGHELNQLLELTHTYDMQLVNSPRTHVTPLERLHATIQPVNLITL